MRIPALATLACLACSAAGADPGYYVITPYDREGQLSAEFRYWSVKPRDEYETVWPEVGISYGVNSRWTTLLLASWIGSSEDATVLSNVSWQNEVLLTQGKQDFDLALHGALIHLAGENPGDSYEFGPIFQTEFGATQLNANLLFERVRKRGTWRPTALKYQWQLRRHGTGWLQFGLQGFGELGPWNDWSPHDEQSHRAGPALFGTLGPGGPQAVQVQAALLFGSTYGDNGRMFSLRVLWPF